LIARKKYKNVLIYGDFKMLDEKDEKVLTYTRRAEDGSTILVVCNFSANEIVWASKGVIGNMKEVLLSTNGKTLADFKSGNVTLAAYEACVVLLG
jgi:glycosidase